MSKRGIHPLLRGLDRPQRVAHSRRAALLSGLESAQRKRYLRLEAEERELSQQTILSCSSQRDECLEDVNLYIPNLP